MGSHRPRHPRRRGEERHTSLVGDPEYEEYGPAPDPDTGEPGARETGRGIPGAGAWEPVSGESRTSLVGGPPGNPPGEQYVEGGWPRVWNGEYRPAGHAEDTVVLGDFGLFERFPGRAAGPRGADPSGRHGGFGGSGGSGPDETGRAGGYVPPGVPDAPDGPGSPGVSGLSGKFSPSGGFGPSGDFGPSGGFGPSGESGPSGGFGPSGESGLSGGFGLAGEFSPSGGFWPSGGFDPGGRDRSGAFGPAPGSGPADGDGIFLAGGETDGRPPAPPWYHRPQRLAAAAGGLALIAFAGFLLVPAILSRLGIGTTPNSALCPTCQFPIPSSSPAPPSPASPASPTMRAARPRPSRAPVAATQPAAPGQDHAPTAAPGDPGATGLAVYYSETAQSGGGFLARVTVVNHDATSVSGWQLVVALPYDSVSALSNAQGYDQDDVLFLQPTAAAPSIAPGGTLVVTITASGPTTGPAECSFNGVACQLAAPAGAASEALNRATTWRAQPLWLR